MVFDSSELTSKFAYHFKQILFSSWRYRQNFAKKQKQRKYSMITGQQNRKKMGVFGQKWIGGEMVYWRGDGRRKVFVRERGGGFTLKWKGPRILNKKFINSELRAGLAPE